MALGKQAKILTDKQVRAVFGELDSRRYPLRDRVVFLLSIKAGMRAVEIASITWGMVTDAEGCYPGPIDKIFAATLPGARPTGIAMQ